MKKNLAAGGFTLIELLVTLVIAAVLMTVAVPSFTAFQRNSELTSIANSLMASINAARAEAMKRGRYAMVVPTDGVNWNNGWTVFVDVDRTQTFSSGSTDITVVTTPAPPAYITITGTGSAAGLVPYIMYDATGYSKLKGTGGFGASTLEFQRNDVSGAEQLKQTRRVKIASTGRVRICTPTSATDVNCSATASAL